MKHYINKLNELFGFEEDYAEFVPEDLIEIPAKYKMDQLNFINLIDGKIKFNKDAYEKAKKDLTIAEYEKKTTAYLDDVSRSWKYDSMSDAITYLTSTNPQFKSEAEVLNEWRDKSWAQAYTIEAGVLPATAEEFISLLPAIPQKPII